MRLTDVKIRQTNPTSKMQRLADGNGLYLEITPKGSKLWNFRYRFAGKQKTLSFGKYPDVGLKDARDKLHEARKKVAAGVDPSAERKVKKAEEKNPFRKVALEWWHARKRGWSDNTANHKWSQLEKHALPTLKSRPIDEVTTGELLKVLRKIEEAGYYETASRVCGHFSNIFIYAVAAGYTDRNPASDLSKILEAPPLKRTLPAITDPDRLGELLRAIDVYKGTFVVRMALRLCPYFFLRPGELRYAEWHEFDFEEGLWDIPKEKMKMERGHIVPLARQAVEILQELHQFNGGNNWVFESPQSCKSKPISENTLNQALRTMGFKADEIVSHGFRTTASTILNEKGYNPDHIEMQLSHLDQNTVRGTYNKAIYLEDRKKMMQEWADYLDSLKNS